MCAYYACYGVEINNLSCLVQNITGVCTCMCAYLCVCVCVCDCVCVCVGVGVRVEEQPSCITHRV